MQCLGQSEKTRPKQSEPSQLHCPKRFAVAKNLATAIFAWLWAQAMPSLFLESRAKAQSRNLWHLQKVELPFPQRLRGRRSEKAGHI